MAFIVIGIAVLLGLYMAWGIGANDVANSMADAVGSRAITIKRAVIAAGICEFAGALLVGSHVTDTVRKGIVSTEQLAGSPETLVIGMACALLAAAVWLHVATWMGVPVSTTHSIIGAVAGFGVVAAGWGAVHWGKIGQIVASWFISPVAGGILAFIIFKLISRSILGRERPARAAIKVTPYIVFFAVVVVVLATVYKGLQHIVAERAAWLSGHVAVLLSLGIGLAAALVARILLKRYLSGRDRLSWADQVELVERVFAPLVVITSCSVAFAHGANDVANAVGPLAAVVDIVRSGTVQMKVHVPAWILALGGAGIVLGLATYGYRVMHTVGTKITQITPSRGVAADIAATTTVLICTRLKLPVSTTHTLVGAIMGIGLARGLGAVNKRVARDIFTSWLITVPAAALLSIVFFLVARLLLLGSIAKIVQAAAAAGG
ncbi:MAG: inorganic phosphate transporter [Candidatus Brocadiae bacterium]|nr:inorganic phosphate transporter [Candidatus Brocadiia bacterium]